MLFSTASNFYSDIIINPQARFCWTMSHIHVCACIAQSILYVVLHVLCNAIGKEVNNLQNIGNRRLYYSDIIAKMDFTFENNWL